ncbi:PucR family transcriptional regulator [Microbacterium sp.]|uniref:PucR family transcriptional regulator n=1 Tax=Microbacterium sp. TaxID=51671 RepID=UPI002811FD1E|nr:helix-turn-helix domain-containing protein [Microbacterium sp.]
MSPRTSRPSAADGEDARPASPEQRALALQVDLTAILARGKGVDRLLRGWHRQTGEPVAVFDRLGRPLARAEFPAGDLGRVKDALDDRAPRLGEVLRLPAGTVQPEGAVELTPFAGNATVRGYLARLSTGDATAELAAPALRSLLALEYERHWLMDEPERRRRDRQLGRLLGLTEEGGAKALLRSLGIDALALRGLVIEARDETHAEVLVDDLAALFSAQLVRHRGRVVECLVAVDPVKTLVEYGLTVPIGVGTSLAPHHASRSMRQARLALEASRRVGGAIEYRDGGAHDFLLQVASPEYREAFADATLGVLERARGGDALLATLHVWLIEHRSIEATADRMKVHRHTVRNRIQRAAQLTGHDLDSIDTQTELWLALKARGLEQPEN